MNQKALQLFRLSANPANERKGKGIPRATLILCFQRRINRERRTGAAPRERIITGIPRGFRCREEPALLPAFKGGKGEAEA